jgi:hypothetical protein
VPEIYGLMSNRDNEIRYIGKTFRPSEERFHEHYWNLGKCETPLYEWIHHERWYGFDIDYAVVEICPLGNLNRLEAYWISGLPALTNLRLHRCRGPLYQPDVKKLRQIKLRKRRYLENWRGYRGVRFFPAWDSWQVHIQSGGRFYFLLGDGGPPTMSRLAYRGVFGHKRYFGDWHFSKGSAAVTARDEERMRLNQNRGARGLPDLVWPVDLVNLESEEDEFEDERFYRNAYPILTPEACGFLTIGGPMLTDHARADDGDADSAGHCSD